MTSISILGVHDIENMECQALEMFTFYDIRDPQRVTQHESFLSLRVHLGFMFEFNHRNQWKMGC